jgi:glycosyltransferase involved in cell wall biosynthesis
VNFRVELIIADDASTDNTKGIIESYRQKFPDLIHPVYNEKNLGLVLNNWKAFSLCRGKYIAILDSDDYWTDKHKLSKQVAILESRPEIVMIHHNGLILDKKAEVSKLITAKKEQEEYGLDGILLKGGLWNSSVMYRNLGDKIFMPKWMLQQRYNQDYVRHVLHARFGRILFLPENLGVHRKHDSNWSQVDLQKKERIYQNNIYIAKNLKTEVDSRFTDLLNLQIARHYALLAALFRWRMLFVVNLMLALVYLPKKFLDDFKDVMYFAFKSEV